MNIISERQRSNSFLDHLQQTAGILCNKRNTATSSYNTIDVHVPSKQCVGCAAAVFALRMKNEAEV
eukprot:scaffold1815_cov134-Skeletonema_marinoi.AAC.5